MLYKKKKDSLRMIALDIETTGMNKNGLIYQGHKIIEIGAVEIIDRQFTGNNFHTYIKPNRLIDHEAFLIHGISSEFLSDKKIFSDICLKFIEYIKDANIIVHNAKFDIKFLEYEIYNVNYNYEKISKLNKIIDTLIIARSLFPGKKNNLNALCQRYKINISNRKLHGALIDAHLLAELYLRMTSIQKKMDFQPNMSKNNKNICIPGLNKKRITILNASEYENKMHLKYLEKMKNTSSCLWNKKI